MVQHFAEILSDNNYDSSIVPCHKNSIRIITSHLLSKPFEQLLQWNALLQWGHTCHLYSITLSESPSQALTIFTLQFWKNLHPHTIDYLTCLFTCFLVLDPIQRNEKLLRYTIKLPVWCQEKSLNSPCILRSRVKNSHSFLNQILLLHYFSKSVWSRMASPHSLLTLKNRSPWQSLHISLNLFDKSISLSTNWWYTFATLYRSERRPTRFCHLCKLLWKQVSLFWNKFEIKIPTLIDLLRKLFFIFSQLLS